MTSKTVVFDEWPACGRRQVQVSVREPLHDEETRVVGMDDEEARSFGELSIRVGVDARLTETQRSALSMICALAEGLGPGMTAGRALLEGRGGESDVAYRRLWAELFGEEAGNAVPDQPRDPTMVSEGCRPWWRRRRGARS